VVGEPIDYTDMLNKLKAQQLSTVSHSCVTVLIHHITQLTAHIGEKPIQLYMKL